MNKLFRFLTILTLLFGIAGNTFAADIVVRAVKIKKRNINPLVAFPSSDDERNYLISDVEIATTTETDPKAPAYTKFDFEFAVDTKAPGKVASVSINITILDCNLKPVTKAIDCKLNAKGMYEASYQLPSSKECPQSLTEADITVRTALGGAIDFSTDLGKMGKEKGKDACSKEYKLKSISYTTQLVSGVYVTSFSFDFDGKDFPDEVTVLLQYTDCKGNKATVPTKLSYNEAAGIVIGSGGLIQNKDCPWTLTYAEIYAANPCGDETTWAVDFGQVKTNGTGTRDGANSVKTSKPTLK